MRGPQQHRGPFPSSTFCGGDVKFIVNAASLVYSLLGSHTEQQEERNSAPISALHVIGSMASLNLSNSPAGVSVKLKPLVLFNICDAYIRRNESQVRVIGTLLGHIADGVVHVQNCYAVPHNESNDQVRTRVIKVTFSARFQCSCSCIGLSCEGGVRARCAKSHDQRVICL